MTLRTFLPAVFAWGLSSAVGHAREWEAFTPEGFQFKVLLPGKPKEQTQSVSGVSVKIWSLDGRGGAFAVSIADVPGLGGGAGESQQRLDGARDGMLRNVGGTLTKEEKVKLADKYPGRQIEADLPAKKGVLRSRLYLVDGRLYQMVVIGMTDFATGADADRFLDSLQLTGGPKAPAKGAEPKGADPKAPEPKAPARKDGK